MKSHIYLSDTKMESLSAAIGFDGIVLGSEYCFHLLPGEGELRDLSAFASTRPVEVTVLIPYLRDHQMKAFVKVIEKIDGKVRTRLVVNDWGTMYFFSKVLPRSEVVLGRLLSGQKACLRIDNSPFLTGDGKKLLLSDLFASGRMREHFQHSYGVTAISANFAAGVVSREVPYRRVIQFPYVLVTVTDYCPYRGNVPSAFVTSCEKPCRKGYVVLSNDSLGRPMYQRGKGRFFKPLPDNYELSDNVAEEAIIYRDVP